VDKEIKINTVGRIVSGSDEGWFIMVEDDTAGTGGYYIFIANRPDVKGNSEIDDGGTGYDDWCIDLAEVAIRFDQYQWVIEWES
jgi:hypothetical protein